MLSILVHNVHNVHRVDQAEFLFCFLLHMNTGGSFAARRRFESLLRSSLPPWTPSVSLHSPKQLVVLLVCIGGDVDGGFILLHKLQEFAGVQARVAIIKVLEKDEGLFQEHFVEPSFSTSPVGPTHF